MALDLGLTTHQLSSALDGVARDIHTRGQRLDEAINRSLTVPAGEAAFRTAAVGRRPYISARTGPEGLLGSRPPTEVPGDWTALSVDGSHINVDRHLPLRCHLINLGGCAITYGRNFGCQLFSEPALAVDDEDLYLRPPDGARGETLIAGPLLSALRTVREVERLADAVENLADDRPVLALLDVAWKVRLTCIANLRWPCCGDEHSTNRSSVLQPRRWVWKPTSFTWQSLKTAGKPRVSNNAKNMAPTCCSNVVPAPPVAAGLVMLTGWPILVFSTGYCDR